MLLFLLTFYSHKKLQKFGILILIPIIYHDIHILLIVTYECNVPIYLVSRSWCSCVPDIGVDLLIELQLKGPGVTRLFDLD